MKKIYNETLCFLINMIDANRTAFINNTNKFKNSVGKLMRLGDENFDAYKNMVDTNEYRMSKFIERIAIKLFEESKNENIIINPKMGDDIKILLKGNSTITGIIICDSGGEYYSKFMSNQYNVDNLLLVLLINPDEFGYKTLISDVNEFNRKCKINIVRTTILEFWTKNFGENECEELIEFINEFNKQAQLVIGFNTIISPTDKAIKNFEKQCAELLKNYDYKKNIPVSVYQKQIDIMDENFYNRELWKLMVGKSNFAKSFITSEWFYTIYKISENLDLTSVVSGYLKSIEQLLSAIIELNINNGISIQTKTRNIVEYTKENEQIIDFTLGSLENVIKNNTNILTVNVYVKNALLDTIDDWRNKQRNGYFHKGNLHSIKKVNEIRDKAFYLYYLILGSFKIEDKDLIKLGIEKQ